MNCSSTITFIRIIYNKSVINWDKQLRLDVSNMQSYIKSSTNSFSFCGLKVCRLPADFALLLVGAGVAGSSSFDSSESWTQIELHKIIGSQSVASLIGYLRSRPSQSKLTIEYRFNSRFRKWNVKTETEMGNPLTKSVSVLTFQFQNLLHIVKVSVLPWQMLLKSILFTRVLTCNFTFVSQAGICMGWRDHTTPWDSWHFLKCIKTNIYSDFFYQI